MNTEVGEAGGVGEATTPKHVTMNGEAGAGEKGAGGEAGADGEAVGVPSWWC